MKLAYLVLAHNNPGHLARLVSNLLSGHATVYIHVDRKSDLAKFVAACSSLPSGRIHFIEQRFAIYWGAFSTVEATFALMRAALGATSAPDYLVLLSGADYPLRTQSDIERFFEHWRGAEFLNRVAIPHEGAGKLMNRVESWTPMPGKWSTRPLRFLHRTAVRLRLISARRNAKKGLAGLRPYGGSTWWGLTHDCAAHVLNFADTHPDVMTFFHNLPCVDETVIPTIIGNSPFAKQVSRNLTYTDWSAKQASPAELTDIHVDRFTAPLFSAAHDIYGYGELLFARKFNDSSGALITRLDALNLKKQNPDRNLHLLADTINNE